MLFLYNSLTRKKEPFSSENPQVSIYACGPTVYDYAHIGNLRAYVFVDLLRRYLQYSGYKTDLTINITDVEDKIIKLSQTAGQTIGEYTKPFIEAFFRDLRYLNTLPPTHTPRASEYIDTIVAIIDELLNKGIAYKAVDGIYFDISKDPGYRRLFSETSESMMVNAAGRLNGDTGKNDNQDFVLWKLWKEVDGGVSWESPIGKGRPGWHIECSAMLRDIYPNGADIHCGGVDLLFPHHTN